MVLIGFGGKKEEEIYDVVLGVEEERCMKELAGVVEGFILNNSKRTRWDLSFLIRTRGRWGKCGRRFGRISIVFGRKGWNFLIDWRILGIEVQNAA